MSLKPDRSEDATVISMYMNEVGQRGGIVAYSTVGSGAGLDQASQLVTYAATASGKAPAGLLLNDMVNLDLTRQHYNQHRDEVQKGGKVTILTRGWVVTDQIASGITIAGGDKAYMANGGRITNAYLGDAATPKVGRFETTKDEDGYARVSVNLPN